MGLRVYSIGEPQTFAGGRPGAGPRIHGKPGGDLASWLGVKTAFIEKAGPRENEYNESFNRKPPDGLLNGEIFGTLKEPNIPIERGRRCDCAIRPHGAFGYRP